MFPWSETGMLGNFGVALRVPSSISNFKMERGTSLETLAGKGLILMCARKVGNAFQTKQGNRTSCRDQEGRRGSEEAVPGPSVFPSGEPGVHKNPQVPHTN